MFLKDQWYAVAWDRDIGGKPVGRTICGEKIVFYRKRDRSLVALEDCCPHRLFPLSQGSVQDDRLVCGYHGLTFIEGGQCVHMPSQDTINPNAHIRAYPVVERYRFIWVWIGDAALADPARIPALPWCADPAWAFDGGTYQTACDYRLVIDNLMDLTHETYVHSTSIGQKELTEAPFEAKLVGDRAVVSRWTLNVEPPPFWVHNWKSKELVDRWQICEYSVPSVITIDVGVARAGTGAPQGDRSQGISATVINLITPETETSCLYHWGFARNFETGDQGLTMRIRDAQGGVFMEDIDVFMHQQQNILARPDRKMMSFNIDAGGVLARRLLDRALQNAASTAA
ncbi:MAG: Rieske 2Fe-2S domain-containing protein [Elstera sp.]